MFFVALKKNNFSECWRRQRRQSTASYKWVFYTPGVLMGCWLAWGGYSRVLVSIRCTLWRKSPTHPYLLWLDLYHSTFSAHKTKLRDISQKHKLHRTQSLILSEARSSKMQPRGDVQPSQSHAQTVFLEAGQARLCMVLLQLLPGSS